MTSAAVLSLLSLGALWIILGLTVAMALSCYDAGILGTISLCAMAVAAWVAIIDFNTYQLARPTVFILVAVAFWLARNFVNFLNYRRRERERVRVRFWELLS